MKRDTEKVNGWFKNKMSYVLHYNNVLWVDDKGQRKWLTQVILFNHSNTHTDKFHLILCGYTADKISSFSSKEYIILSLSNCFDLLWIFKFKIEHKNKLAFCFLKCLTFLFWGFIAMLVQVMCLKMIQSHSVYLCFSSV